MFDWVFFPSEVLNGANGPSDNWIKHIMTVRCHGIKKLRRDFLVLLRDFLFTGWDVGSSLVTLCLPLSIPCQSWCQLTGDTVVRHTVCLKSTKMQWNIIRSWHIISNSVSTPSSALTKRWHSSHQQTPSLRTQEDSHYETSYFLLTISTSCKDSEVVLTVVLMDTYITRMI